MHAGRKLRGHPPRCAEQREPLRSPLLTARQKSCLGAEAAVRDRPVTTQSTRFPPSPGPPSRMRSTSSPSDFRTCSAMVGESSVNRLALGAAIGTWHSASSAKANAFAGTRRPTVGNPAVTMSGNKSALGQHQGQRAGPESRAKLLGHGRPFDRECPRTLAGLPHEQSAGWWTGGP